MRLPSWVSIIATGRPQVEHGFSAWTPEWIMPKHEENLKDLRQLLAARIKQGQWVAEGEVEQAVDIVLDKSEVCVGWASGRAGDGMPCPQHNPYD